MMELYEWYEGFNYIKGVVSGDKNGDVLVDGRK